MDSIVFSHELIAGQALECEEIGVQLKYAELSKENPPKNEGEALNLLLRARRLSYEKRGDLTSADVSIGVRDPYPDEDVPIEHYIVALIWLAFCAVLWTVLVSHKWIPSNFMTHFCAMFLVSVSTHLIFMKVKEHVYME